MLKPSDYANWAQHIISFWKNLYIISCFYCTKFLTGIISYHKYEILFIVFILTFQTPVCTTDLLGNNISIKHGFFIVSAAVCFFLFVMAHSGSNIYLTITQIIMHFYADAFSYFCAELLTLSSPVWLYDGTDLERLGEKHKNTTF